MSIELILLAVNINLVAFSTFLGDIVGQVYALIVLTVAAAEAAIGLAILVAYLPQPRLDRGRGHQSDEGLSAECIEAIVFLPLLGAIIAGADLARRRARIASRARIRRPPHDDHAAPLVPDSTHTARRRRTAHAEIGIRAMRARAAEPPAPARARPS